VSGEPVKGHHIAAGAGELATFSCGTAVHYTGYGPSAGSWLSHWAEGPCHVPHKVEKVEACPGCAGCREKGEGDGG
jgi:hypothetical protein